MSVGPADDFNDGFGAAEKKVSINFSGAKTTFCLNLHYNVDNSYLLVNTKKSESLKQTRKMSTFHLSFV